MGILNADIGILSKWVSLSSIRHPSLSPSSCMPFAMTVNLINKMPKVGISLGFSFKKLSHKAPYPSILIVFGCLYFLWLHPYSSHKLNPKSNPYVFLCYSITRSAFLYFDLILRKPLCPIMSSLWKTFPRLRLPRPAPHE